VAEHVFSGWDSLTQAPTDSVPPDSDSTTPPPDPPPPNRFTNLYTHITHLTALTTAAWQAYAFTNGVLNTDNTSIAGLSLDFGPFAFLDNYDPSYTPNHDDHTLRYAYGAQPSAMWWNLERLGESLAELLGAADVDAPAFVAEGVDGLMQRAEASVMRTGAYFKDTFLAEYTRLMRARLGLRTEAAGDFELVSALLDAMQALELDFHHFFRRLAGVQAGDVASTDAARALAGRFFHAEGVGGGVGDAAGQERLGAWLELWGARVGVDWEGAGGDAAREAAMKRVNPKFVARGWVLDEIITRVTAGDREVLGRVMRMAEQPFDESWGGDAVEEERWCGDVPRLQRGLMCSCSS
jgi:uncharacterized protein YdiU (UPF0061 family)